mmetsp:Transcript_6535/g.11280  ORF Transcript_6535/g.11280 Transcript_6535/m.11280 type:complete len:121 (-) Transcript_6535:485-847(-)|eukprot:CAMPEP_0196662300 /NCGR_PEP_ID=MMETSP1086-20130531/48093_1 /TAXON_ID=77921 /ORGANISM="Cyanoptyche  gloeocystis , Strain SAG4.97" /LENGTH=120 /DNA_ID=CAMNT_0041997595 /DNA_START=20 /DNA_END=382 /DNA_ORIENTATION=+
MEDFELPQASISRIVRKVLSPDVQVGKDAKSGFSKAATVFILYITATANDLARNNKRSTITAQDVIAALQELHMDDSISALEDYLAGYRKETAIRKGVASADLDSSAKSSRQAESERTGD